MKKSSALKAVNIALFFDFALLGASGLAHARIPYDLYSKVHPVLGYALCALVALHLFLNWSWVKGLFARRG